VYKDLKKAGYKVYPVNPNAEEVLGDKCYPNLGDLPTKPDVVDVVVPPKVTEEIVKTCKRLGITKVWMQPGSESETTIKFCDENGIDTVYGVCVMIERRSRM
ncbi:CoA-binding protein, partial [Candidatus Bathyarchaeota archaeon]